MPAGYEVRVEGAARKIEQIFRFDKDIWNEIQKGVRSATEGIVQEGRGNYPSDNALRNWGTWITAKGGRDLSFEPSRARSGVRSRFRSRGRQGFREIRGQVYNKDAAGAIYLLAGSRDKSGEFFNRNINNRRGGSVGSRGDGTWPRALGPAWTNNVEEARDEIGRVVEAAIRKVNR
jgi:hypothetical protein